VLDDRKKPPKEKPFANHKFRDRFKEYYGTANVEHLTKELGGITESTFRQWLNGYTLPTAEKLIALSKYFNISIDYLLGIEDEPTRDIDIRSICKKTGMSQYSIETLIKCKDDEIKAGMIHLHSIMRVVDFLIKSSKRYSDRYNTSDNLLSAIGNFLSHDEILEKNANLKPIFDGGVKNILKEDLYYAGLDVERGECIVDKFFDMLRKTTNILKLDGVLEEFMLQVINDRLREARALYIEETMLSVEEEKGNGKHLQN